MLELSALDSFPELLRFVGATPGPGPAGTFPKNKKVKREHGRRGGAMQRLHHMVSRERPAPSVTLPANVPSLDNKMDEIYTYL